MLYFACIFAPAVALGISLGWLIWGILLKEEPPKKEAREDVWSNLFIASVAGLRTRVFSGKPVRLLLKPKDVEPAECLKECNEIGCVRECPAALEAFEQMKQSQTLRRSKQRCRWYSRCLHAEQAKDN